MSVSSAAHAEHVPSAAPLPATGPLVLVVEDELAIGQLVRSYLGASGYRVLWVRSGEDALDQVRIASKGLRRCIGVQPVGQLADEFEHLSGRRRLGSQSRRHLSHLLQQGHQRLVVEGPCSSVVGRRRHDDRMVPWRCPRKDPALGAAGPTGRQRSSR